MTTAPSLAEREMFTEILEAIFHDHKGSDATTALNEFGVADVLRTDRAHAIPIVFELQGSSASTSATLNHVMAMSLEPVLAGCLDLPVLLPMTASSATQVGDGGLRVAGVLLGTPDPARVVVGGEPSDGVLGVINVHDHDVELRPVSGIDPTLALTTLTADRVPVEKLVLGPPGATAWQEALVWGRIALAAELVGTGRAALSLATDHAANRAQFGQPIGSFQAVKHRLANALIEIEAASSAVAAAAIRPTRLSAMVAKSAAGRAARTACAHALQVLGAVGFTLEHPFHRFQRRSIALDHLLGSSDDLPREIGAALRTLDRVPAIVDLEDDQ
jgi:hypothetical protein